MTSTKRFSVITICNWDRYQTDNRDFNQPINHQINHQLTINQPTTNQQVTTNKNGENVRMGEGENSDVGRHQALQSVTSDCVNGAQRLAGAGPASKVSDAEWLEGLAKDPTYAGIDVTREHGKMVNWCATNRKQPSRRRFINWLNRAEKPMVPATVSGTPQPASDSPTTLAEIKDRLKWVIGKGRPA